jgi:hypothetical protein
MSGTGAVSSQNGRASEIEIKTATRDFPLLCLRQKRVGVVQPA